jgi:hypothetical protein
MTVAIFETIVLYSSDNISIIIKERGSPFCNYALALPSGSSKSKIPIRVGTVELLSKAVLQFCIICIVLC